MIVPYKLLAVITVLVIAFSAVFYAGWNYGKGNVVHDVQTVTVEKRVEVQGETKVEYRDRIVTVTKTVLKDGTTTETTKTEEKAKETSHETVEHSITDSTSKESKNGPAAPVQVGDRYSLGLRYQPAPSSIRSVTTARDPYAIGLQLGRRVIGPVWVDVGITGHRDVSIGIRIDW